MQRFARDLGASLGVEVDEGGCLASCGAGPNVALLPEGRIAHHVSTPADVSELLAGLTGGTVPSSLLHATELRVAGNAMAVEGDLKGARDKYLEARTMGT